MKMIRDIRERQAWEQHKRAGPLPIILGAVIAFGIGLLGISGLVRAPNLFPQKTQAMPVAPREARASNISIDTGTRRIDRAETVPLLTICMPVHKLGVGPNQAIAAGDLYRVLHTGSTFARIASVTGIRQKAMDEAGFATLWAEVADCIYRQNGWMICDPDNRALAVESATALLRRTSATAKPARATATMA